ncbi:MAG: tetratricopeptide repeat protein [Planctomycetia bacterium]
MAATERNHVEPPVVKASSVPPSVEPIAPPDWIDHARENFLKYLLYATVVILAVGGVVAVQTFNANIAAQKNADSWREFFAAANPGQFEVVAERYAGTPAGRYALLRVADMKYKTAIDGLLNDRSAAVDELKEASKIYEQLADDPVAEPLVRRQAMLTVGLALESQSAIDKAVPVYERVKAEFAGSPEAARAEMRLKALAAPEARAFYNQLAKYEPPTPSSDLPDPTSGFPALPPGFGKAAGLPPMSPEAGKSTAKSSKPLIELPEFDKVSVPPPPKAMEKKTDEPKVEPAPTKAAPAPEAPKAEAPKAEPPKEDAPKPAEPAKPAEAPKAETPKTESPAPAEPAKKAD